MHANIGLSLQCRPSCVGSACRENRVVSGGIKAPLQVFKTRASGWGLRCSRDLRPGEYICHYAGLLMTDEEAVRWLF